jgi:hypothetical protein
LGDFLGNHVAHRRLQCAFYTKGNALAELFFEITSDAEKVAQGFSISGQFDGDVESESSRTSPLA